MPDIASERQEYDNNYQWPEGGHEWSWPWGSAADQWVTTIYRRIFRLLPTRAILEIAPGFGRWTLPPSISESWRGVKERAGQRDGSAVACPDPGDGALREGSATGGEQVADGIDAPEVVDVRVAVREPSQPRGWLTADVVARKGAR